LGQVYHIAGNQSLLLDDPQSLWVVRSGSVALFLVGVEAPPDPGRRYLATCHLGEIVLPLGGAVAGQRWGLLAIALGDAELVDLGRDRLQQQLHTADPEGLALIQDWLEKLTPDDVAWTMPVTWAELEQTHDRLLQHLVQQSAQTQRLYGQRLQARADFSRQMGAAAIADLATLFPSAMQVRPLTAMPESELSPDLALLRTAQRIGQAIGVTICPPLKEKSGRDPVQAIALASGLRVRRVLLGDRWWQEDCGALLAYRHQENQPVALIPIAPARYVLYDPCQQTETPVDEALDASLSPFAQVFYPPLPEQLRRLVDLLWFSWAETGSDWKTLVLTGMAATGLGLLLPQATAILIDQAIPSGDRGLLAQMGLGLIAASLGSVLFQLAQGIALVRLEAKVEARMQIALWDRLLRLSVPFFRQFSVGDLRSRVAVINTIRRQISGASLRTLLGSTFTLLNLGLLMYYSPTLAGIALLMGGAIAAITLLSAHLILQHLPVLQELEGSLLGLVVQLINGLAKLRVAAAEERAFAAWGQQYSQQQRRKLQVQQRTDTLTVVNQVMPVLASGVIFAIAFHLTRASPGLSTGTFLAFHVAFGSFLTGITSFSNTLLELLAAVSLGLRIRPILAAAPEIAGTRSHPGQLSGRVALETVTFRYPTGTVPILERVTIRVEPGEFVAIVGPSGGGKSTIFRLLLGFETPQSGQVLYDGQDLRGLDVAAVRRQLGVLLQTSRVMTASVFDNIAGGMAIAMADAWDAAHLAGLAADISAMPMEMHTVVSEGGSNLSGGQRQRLLIARALALKPRILLLDEATSYLDNRTQAIVSASLEQLQITRIVIAHRLSTIRHADRIYVLEGGQILQQGRFQDLMNQDGLFQRLMQRQTP